MFPFLSLRTINLLQVTSGFSHVCFSNSRSTCSSNCCGKALYIPEWNKMVDPAQIWQLTTLQSISTLLVKNSRHSPFSVDLWRCAQARLAHSEPQTPLRDTITWQFHDCVRPSWLNTSCNTNGTSRKRPSPVAQCHFHQFHQNKKMRCDSHVLLNHGMRWFSLIHVHVLQGHCTFPQTHIIQNVYRQGEHHTGKASFIGSRT